MKSIIALLIGVVVLFACGSKPVDDVQTTDSLTTNRVSVTEAQFKAAAIEIGKIERKTIVETIEVNGKLDVPPQNLVTIAAPMGGFIRSTQLLQGMKVKKGDVLATLENQEYVLLQQDYLDNYSKLEFLKAEYQRQQELAKENVNAQKSLQQSKSQFESTDAMVKGLEARLSMINISASDLREGKIKSTINVYSPINGFVTTVNVNIGQFVNATDVMFNIVNLDHIHAELLVYEKDISKIEVGQRVTFQLANSSVTHRASVHLIGKEISPERTVGVHCHIEETDHTFLPGMFVTANIEAASKYVDVVPVDAISNFEGEDFIFVPIGSDEFKAVPVTVGSGREGFVEVRLPEDVQAGTPLVTHGAFELMGLLKNKQE